MKTLKNKIVFQLTVNLIIIFAIITYINHTSQESSISALAGDNSRTLLWSLDQHVTTLMLDGANEEIQILAVKMAAADIANEITVINDLKEIIRSSDIDRIKRVSEDPAWATVFETRQPLTFDTIIGGEPFKVGYQPMINQQACLDCHDDKAPEAILGGLKILSSQKNPKAVVKKGLSINILMSVFGVLAITAMLYTLVSTRIFKPLKTVREKLVRASQGEIDQEINVKSSDEIGLMLDSIKSLLVYIKEFEQASARIAENDLSIRIAPRSKEDSLGYSFRKMILNLSGIINQLKHNAQELVSAAEEISTTADATSRGAVEQSDQINQISTAVEQMSATIIEASRNALEVSNFSKTSADMASEGGELVRKTIEGNESLADTTRRTASSIAQLADLAREIENIIEVIDNITDQTNLLALNAAIEAARAGEQGRGFSVVADEVRKLADRTGKATSEIKKMIENIRNSTDLAVNSMQSGVTEVGLNHELTLNAGQNLEKLISMTHQVMDMIQQVATASEEQSVTAEEISRRVVKITEITRRTASGSEQSAATARKLNQLAEIMQQLVSKFKIS